MIAEIVKKEAEIERKIAHAEAGLILAHALDQEPGQGLDPLVVAEIEVEGGLVLVVPVVIDVVIGEIDRIVGVEAHAVDHAALIVIIRKDALVAVAVVLIERTILALRAVM